MSTVHVRVRTVHGVQEGDWAVLADTERERASRRIAQAPFVTAHAALHQLVAEHVDIDPRKVVVGRRCPSCDSDRHGRPFVADHPDIWVSLSYSPDKVVVALTAVGPVGVDVEGVEATDFDGFDMVTLAACEQTALSPLRGHDLLSARARLWARKEAILKATGYGLVVDPTQVVVAGWNDTAALVEWRGAQPEPPAVALVDVPLDDDHHRASLAVLATVPVAVHQS
ncbi:MAG TPA: 4'-phosphopantetheinyl transferase superfamily protein [Phycicoccus sp.]|nr:4'-phosphopantetheinyl transferase superfamily protein [Phycicoccus sp.]